MYTVEIGGHVRILLVPDTMPVRHRADFKEALSTLRRLRNQEDQAYYQNWWQSSSSSWWQWQDSWWHSSCEHHHEDGPSTDRSGKPAKTVIGLIIRGMSLKIWCKNYSDNSVTANAVYLLSPTGGVKSVPPNTEKFLPETLQRKL